MTAGPKRRPKDRDEIARNMSAIRARDNRTETELRRALHRMGLRYRKYSAGLIGRPDIVFPAEKVAVFVDGDYWHGRMVREGGIEALESYYTRKQQTYWVAKLSRNVARDDRVTTELQALGWKVLRFWESDIKRDVAPAARRVAATVRRRRASRVQATLQRQSPSLDMATSKTRKSGSKRLSHVKRGSASKRPARKKGRASHTLDGPDTRASADNSVARVSIFAADALAVFTRGVRHQLAVLAAKQVPTAAIIDGHLVRGIPRKVGSGYVLDTPLKGRRGKHRPAKR